jgi:hypothetical protein
MGIACFPKTYMKIQKIESNIFIAIKVISTIVIISAIALEIGNIYANLTDLKIPSSLNPIFWVERFALSAHFIEAIIAALYSPSKGKSSLQYSIYTFLVGTVGLWELFDSDIKTFIKKTK